MFKRGFSTRARRQGYPAKLDWVLRDLEKDGWVRDLFRRWRPGGQPLGEAGLRLALRDDEGHFYRFGGRAAALSVEETKGPRVTVDATYDGRPGDEAHQTYSPTPEDFDRWTATIDTRRAAEKTSREKALIEAMLAHPDSRHLIDLETTFPGGGARRIDLMTLEMVDGRPTVIAGEVKTYDDGRMRRNAEAWLTEDGKPEIFKQRERYRHNIATNREAMATQYAIAALQMIRLADAAGIDWDVPEAFRAAAEEGTVAVDAELRLIVVGESREARNYASWPPHRKRLIDAGFCGVELVEGQGLGQLSTVTAWSE